MLEEKFKCENVQCNNMIDGNGFCEECSNEIEKGYSRIVICETCSTTLIKKLFIKVEKKEQVVFIKQCMYCQKEEE